MKTHTVIGGGGIKLHVRETGSPVGKPVLFIHAFSQCGLAWNRQLHSDLANDFRLVAMDIRGHGMSEKPRDAYGDSKLWADDVNAVITTLDLNNPMLVAWSYAGVIVSDYVSFYGDEAIAGINWVDAISRLGDPLLQEGFIGDEFLAAVPGCFSENVDESVEALEKVVRMCVHEEPLLEELYLMLGYNTIVPPHVRLALFSRALNNDSVISGITKPMLVSYGEEDPVVLPSMAKHIAGLGRNAKLSAYPAVAHSPFWEAAERFSRELREFRESV